MQTNGNGRVVAITGGSSGIGRSTAVLFAERGWNVGLIARGEQGLQAASADVGRAGVRVATASADVADPDALERAADAIEAALGPIDVWINDAGAGFYGRFVDITEEEYRRVTDVTYMGVVHGTRTALKRMQARGKGTIVNVGSLAAYRGAPLQVPYSAAKFAVRGFTEAVRSELIHDGSPVHLSMVHPPSVNTPFCSHAGSRLPDGEPRPLPPVYQPEIIADAIYLAATSKRREILVTGTTVQIAWISRIAPALADRFAALTGFATQQSTSEHVRQNRDPALFEPAKRIPTAHGPFDSEALSRSAQVAMTKHPVAVGIGLTVAAGLLASMLGGRRMRRA